VEMLHVLRLGDDKLERKASSRRVSTHYGANASGWEVNAKRVARIDERRNQSEQETATDDVARDLDGTAAAG